jgi:hypothetical protein
MNERREKGYQPLWLECDRRVAVAGHAHKPHAAAQQERDVAKSYFNLMSIWSAV